MSLKKYDIDPANVDPDGLSDGVSTAVVQILLTGALTAGSDLNGLGAAIDTEVTTALTLDGALTSNGVYKDSTGIARHIYILDTGGDDQSSATYTLTGTDSNGAVLIEAILGPAASGFVLTTNRFSTVNTILITSPAAGSTADIGVNGHFTSADGLAHRLDIIGSAHVQTGSTYTITGTDSYGRAQTEDIAGPGSGATIETTKYFLTVSSLVIDTPVASSSIDFGTVDEVIRPYSLNWRAQDEATVAILGVAGTIDIYIEETFDDVSDNGVNITDVTWITATGLDNETGDTFGSLQRHATAVRARVDSYTNGAEFQFHVNQLEY